MASLDDLASLIGGLLRERLTVPTSTLTTEDLDTLLRPAIYLQQDNANATVARHYPYADISGNILVMPMNTGWGLATQLFVPNNAFAAGLATRSYRAGAWTDWQTFDTRSVSDRRYAPIAVADQVADIPRIATPAALKVAPLALTTGVTPTVVGLTRAVRVPIRWNAPLGRWRLHVRNWNPRLGTVVAAAVAFTGLWLGEHNGTGGFTSAPTALRGAFTTPADGSEWVSEWFTADIGGNTDRLLAFGYETTKNPMGLAGGSYQFAEPERAQSTTFTTAASFKYTPFDLWVEAETPAATPIIAGVGDSLTSGVGADFPVRDSWLSQHCRTVGALPLHMSHGGDSLTGFLTVNPEKLTRWAHLAKPDATVWGLGSNDIGSGRTVAQMQADIAELKPIVDAAVGPAAYVSTVQPRNGWDASFETVRAQWNAWLTSRPWVRGVLDFASVVSADGDTLRPEFDAGDGTHLNAAGYAAEAASIAPPLVAPSLAARVQALEDLLA